MAIILLNHTPHYIHLCCRIRSMGLRIIRAASDHRRHQDQHLSVLEEHNHIKGCHKSLSLLVIWRNINVVAHCNPQLFAIWAGFSHSLALFWCKMKLLQHVLVRIWCSYYRYLKVLHRTVRSEYLWEREVECETVCVFVPVCVCVAWNKHRQSCSVRECGSVEHNDRPSFDSELSMLTEARGKSGKNIHFAWDMRKITPFFPHTWKTDNISTV